MTLPRRGKAAGFSLPELLMATGIVLVITALAAPSVITTVANIRLRSSAANVAGLLQNARVDEPYLARLLPRLPEGDSELYSHPSLDEFKNEFDALISPRVREQVDQLGIKLIRYQDL